jgi:hypothetical protein
MAIERQLQELTARLQEVELRAETAEAETLSMGRWVGG